MAITFELGEKIFVFQILPNTAVKPLALAMGSVNEEQQDQIMETRSEEWLKAMCKGLAAVIHNIGDQFDLVRE